MPRAACTIAASGSGFVSWMKQGLVHIGPFNHNMGVIWGYILGLYKGYIGIMEKKMETTIWGLRFRVHIGPFKGVIWVLRRDNGKENGNYYIVY